MTHFTDMQINTKSDFAQLRMEFDHFRSAYVASLESFIAANAGRITTIKWGIESITETADDYSVVAIELVRNDGQTVCLSSPQSVEQGEIEWDSFSNGGEIAEIVAKLQYNGVPDDELPDAAFAQWCGIGSRIGLTLAEAAFEWVLAQPDLAATSSIEIADLQVS